MSFRSQFKTDDKFEKGGVWLEYGSGMRLLCARAGGANKHFQRTLEKLSAPYRRAIEAKVLPPEEGEKLLIEVFAHSIVRGWEGVTKDDLDGSGDATLVEFSPKACVEFFTALPDIFHDVREQVNSAHLYRAHLDEVDGKNS